LTLLTFSMLSFTSIQDRLRFVSVPLQIEAARQGILLRQPNWKPLEPSMLGHVSSHFGRDGTISARSWYRIAGGQAGESIAVSNAERHTNAVDMVGLMPEEDAVMRLSSTLGAGSFFERADEQSCLLSDKMASALGIAATDVGHATLQVMGSELLVRGIFHSPSVDQLLDLDGATIMPVDLRLSSFAEAETVSDELEEGVVDAREVRAFVHHSAADVLILPYEVLRGFGGAIRSIGIRFDDGAPGRLLIEEFLSRVDTGLYASLAAPGRTDTGVHHYRSIGLGSVEGLGALAVPIAIASLIILNAMLGAVYERSREIGIYSSVGLAPLHIAFLFIAEACVYAVLGVTLGYVLGQTLGKILLAFDLLHGIELNYSSSSGIASALLVMAVVLLSTLYPARVAALAAVPDTVRRWRPPPPDGDEWRVTFPFNISGAQIQGSCGFLYSYFASFAGAASGNIYTEDVRLSTSGDAATAPVSEYLLDFTQWLSPYDLGVSQAIRIEFSATPAPGVYSIDIVIDRISGESFHWRRLNSRFFSMLRKQLLIWNTLDRQTRQDHAATAATVLQTRQAAPAMPRETEHAVSSQQEAETRTSPFSVRGILLGAALCLLIGAGTTYTTYVLQGSWGGSNASSPAAVFLFFIVTAILNVILGLIRHRFVLSRADLVLIYVMMLMAVTVPNQAFVGYVIPAISGVFYYATEQNEFASLFFEHIPAWMVPQDRDAITSMYEGLPPGSAIPWDTWVGPLFYWFLFFAAISSLLVCLSVILHRQWSVHERLEYPMAQVPLQMIERSPHGPMAQIGPLYRNKWTWIGFAVPAVILSLKGLNFHFPSVPMVNLTYFGSLPLFDMQLGLGVTWAWIGFSYLVNLDISLSIWLFYLISKLQDNAFVTFGIAPTEKLSSMSQGATADLSHQGMGACVVFVLYGLWVARRHLADVLRKAWRPREGIDDSEELVSYRTAVIGFVVSLVVMGAWLWQSGIPLWIVPLFLGICLVFYIMITRVIATAGIATARSPMITAFVLISGLGSSTIGAAGLTAFAFT
jgi:hypothetical protein